MSGEAEVLGISLVDGLVGQFSGIEGSPATFGNSSHHVTDRVVEVVELLGCY